MLDSVKRLIVNRVNTFTNAAVILLTLVNVFIAANLDQIPGGIGDFLRMRISVKNLLISLVCLTGGAAAFQIFGLMKSAPGMSFRDELARVVKACSVAVVFTLLVPLTSHSAAFNVRIFLVCLPTAIFTCLSARILLRICARRFSRTLNGRRDLIVVGSDSRAADLYRRVREMHHRDFRILGFVDSPEGHSVDPGIQRQMIGGLEELEEILMRQPVDGVLITLPAQSCHAQIQAVIRTCGFAGVEVKYLVDVFHIPFANRELEPGENTFVVSLRAVHDDARLLVKRGIDIVGAMVGLLIFGPLLLIIAALIRLTSSGPALFVQERYGLRKRGFRMYKFRTMVQDAEKLQAGLESRNECQGAAFKIRNDPRVTPVGSILRKTSLDELPQFLNVLRGEMSLVGPRPLPHRDVSRFDQASLMRRFSVKPGLTCLWQANGRSNTSFERWMEMDLQYIDTWSLSLDFAILAKTLPSVLSGRGAS